MKAGDLVKMIRKDWTRRGNNIYIGVYIKERWGNWYVECFSGRRRNRFAQDFWDYVVLNENW